jgi:hypothetical protein
MNRTSSGLLISKAIPGFIHFKSAESSPVRFDGPGPVAILQQGRSRSSRPLPAYEQISHSPPNGFPGGNPML